MASPMTRCSPSRRARRRYRPPVVSATCSMSPPPLVTGRSDRLHALFPLRPVGTRADGPNISGPSVRARPVRVGWRAIAVTGEHHAVTDPLKHVDAIAALAREHGFTVGAAESLTGGAVSSALARGS